MRQIKRLKTERLKTALCFLLLTVGVGLLIWGLSALNNYFREKKLNEGFETLSLSESEASELFGKFVDLDTTMAETTFNDNSTPPLLDSPDLMALYDEYDYDTIIGLGEEGSALIKMICKVENVYDNLIGNTFLVLQDGDINKPWVLDNYWYDYVPREGETVIVYCHFSGFQEFDGFSVPIGSLPAFVTTSTKTRSTAASSTQPNYETEYYGEGWMDMRTTAEYADILDIANNPDEYKSTYLSILGEIKFIQTGLSSCLLILSEPLDDNKRWSIDVMLPDDYIFTVGDKITVYGFFDDFYDVTNETGKLEPLPQIYTADIDTRNIDPVEK